MKYKWLAVIVGILLVFGSMLISMKVYLNVQELQSFINKRQDGIAQVTPVVERFVSAQPTWSSLEEKVKNTVPQIFVNKAPIDLLQPQRSPNQYQSLGSGFFINSEGELITNAHVVDQARCIWIQIPHFGKEQFDVDLIGISHDRDLALLKLKPDSLQKIQQELGAVPYLSLGDSDLVRRADEIMALGYPLGQQGIKSTTGVVSGREQHLIQISAPLNPGNSGGPALNLKGDVVGVSVSGFTEAQNVGYIIPINELKIVLDDLRSVKLLRKPFMGVFFENLPDDTVTEYLKNPKPGGLFVVDVYKDSPMYKAGIQKYDMIYAINGFKIDIHGELLWNGEKISLIDYISQLKLGQEINLIVYRQGERKEIAFNFYQADLLPIHKIYPFYEALDYEIVGGMIIQPLTINHLALLINNCPGLTKYLETKNQTEPALIVTHIFLDSYIARCHTIAPGCILAKVNNEEVKTLDELRTALFKSFDNDKVIIETAESFFLVLPFAKMIEEEKRLANDNFYTITPGMNAIIEKYKQRQKT